MNAPAVRGEDDPVLAWRYWQVDPGSAVLRSISQRRFEWPPGRPLRATCVAGRHRAPDPSCNCGIYGARDLATLRDHGLCLGPEHLLVGLVALWGRIVADARGFRGEWAAPARLWIARGTAGDGAAGRLAEALAPYRVPVGTMALEDAVGEVSAATIAFQAMSRACAAPADPD